jgi:hypothetical protein
MKSILFTNRLAPAIAAVALSLGAFQAAATAGEDAAENNVANEAAFQSGCGGCHGSDAILRWGEARPDFDDRQAFLDDFLQRHYPPSLDDRARIIDHIEAVIADAEDNS